MKYNRLEAIEQSGWQTFPNGKRQQVWRFKCDCGKVCEKNLNLVKTQHIKSCGCLGVESRYLNVKHGHARGGVLTRLYTTWNSMLQRCNNPKAISYKWYGEKGVRVEWKNFQEFLKDMTEGWSPELTIDRKDCFGNYCKENCRWATNREQALNKRPRKKKSEAINDV